MLNIGTLLNGTLDEPLDELLMDLNFFLPQTAHSIQYIFLVLQTLTFLFAILFL